MKDESENIHLTKESKPLECAEYTYSSHICNTNIICMNSLKRSHQFLMA